MECNNVMRGDEYASQSSAPHERGGGSGVGGFLLGILKRRQDSRLMEHIAKGTTDLVVGCFRRSNYF